MNKSRCWQLIECLEENEELFDQSTDVLETFFENGRQGPVGDISCFIKHFFESEDVDDPIHSIMLFLGTTRDIANAIYNYDDGSWDDIETNDMIIFLKDILFESERKIIFGIKNENNIKSIKEDEKESTSITL